MEKRSILLKSSLFILLSLITLSFLYPMVFMLINSLKARADYYADPFALPAGRLHFENYITMSSQFHILQLFRNTAFILKVTCVVVLVLSVFASYAFSKLQPKGKNVIFLCIIATMLIPAQVTLIPVYIMFSKVHLLNSPWSVILVYLAGFLPGNILLMTSFFKGISNEMIEAARIDGSGYFQIVRNVIVPMGLPVIIIIILIFNAVSVWNDLFTPMFLLTKSESKTVMVALAGLVQRYNSDPPYQYAGLLLSSIPAILIYILLPSFRYKQDRLDLHFMVLIARSPPPQTYLAHEVRVKMGDELRRGLHKDLWPSEFPEKIEKRTCVWYNMS